MKNRIIKLTPKFFTDALQGKAPRYPSNLPNEIELLDLRYDLFSNKILAVVRSESFKDLAENQPTAEFNLTFESISKVQSQSAVELEPMKNNMVQQSRKTGKIEEEFSPEQRKLLSFRNENEQVIIKPTHFLKTEWEDINEIVRGLGGRWMKGDIISYWTIPIPDSAVLD